MSTELKLKAVQDAVLRLAGDMSRIIDSFDAKDMSTWGELLNDKVIVIDAADRWAELRASGTCLELSPETKAVCILPATAEAHKAGHESAYVNSARVCWDSTGAWWRE